MAINWTEADIEKVVASVLKNLGAEPTACTECAWSSTGYGARRFVGVYEDMNDAIDAAESGYKAIRAMSLEEREKVIAIIRDLCRKEAPTMAALGVAETKMGRVDHKYAKHLLVADKTPGTEDIVEEFYSLVMQRPINPEIVNESDVRIIYTPLNGTGNIPVRRVLSDIGIKDVRIVKEQESPDGNFPTCPYPNPEIRQVFECGLKMAEEESCDLLLATDPDCDRVGIAVNTGDSYKLMTGNEVGVLLAEYLLSRRKELGILPENPVVVKSFVTTSLVDAVAKKYGAEVKSLLTGFKYIGEFITKLEAKGEEKRFIVGMEESYGYLSGIHARDKDAVVACALICEMAAYYKSKGKSLYEVMEGIYKEHGMYLNALDNYAFKGSSGMAKMGEIMDNLRNNPPVEIAGMKVLSISDFKKSEKICRVTGEKTVIDLPSSNVLYYALENSCGVIVRPSGTEPKIKIYYTACAKTREDAQKIKDIMSTEMKKFME